MVGWKDLDLCSRLESIWNMKSSFIYFKVPSLFPKVYSLYTKICFLTWGHQCLMPSMTGLLTRCGKIRVLSLSCSQPQVTKTSSPYRPPIAKSLFIDFLGDHRGNSISKNYTWRFKCCKRWKTVWTWLRWCLIRTKSFRLIPWSNFPTSIIIKRQINKSFKHSTPDRTVCYFLQPLFLL